MNGFFVARFFLGVTESGLFPGVVYYFSMWYGKYWGPDIPPVFEVLRQRGALLMWPGVGINGASGNTAYRFSSAQHLWRVPLVVF